MGRTIGDPKPQVPPMEDPQLPDLYEPDPGEVPPDDPEKKED